MLRIASFLPSLLLAAVKVILSFFISYARKQRILVLFLNLFIKKTPMKKLLFVALTMFVCYLTSCESVTDNHNSQAEKNTANSKEVYRAAETGDVSRLDNFISADFVNHSGGAGDKEIKGRDSLKAAVGDLHNHIRDLKYDLIASATSDDGAYNFTWVKLTGTTTDSSMGVPPNTKLEKTAVNVISIKDGMFTEHWRFMDTREVAQMMQQGMNSTMDTTKNK
jgi:hypothetical protein